MTSGSVSGALIVVGVDAEGTQVARLALGHGDDPTTLLALHGWQVRRVRDVVKDPVDEHGLEMTFVVQPSLAQPQGIPVLTSKVESRLDADLVTVDGEVALRHQRVAAYALVTSSRGFLMTQFSGRTGAEGLWGLPGGGLDDKEAPERAVVREVWEESGQLVEVAEPLLIHTSRWVGRAPTGRLEDFHAVRVVYRAACPEPTEPVVHDVGGTTAAAVWLPRADLNLLALTSSWRSILRDVVHMAGGGSDLSAVVTAPDQTYGPDQHHHGADANDGARSQP